MSSSIATMRQATVAALSEEAQNPERRFRALRFFLGLFLASSIAAILIFPNEARAPLQLFRIFVIGCTSVLVLRLLPRTSLSLQGAAWLASGLYAFGTVLYTIDIPATVLRSTAFTALTIAAFNGASICYRQTPPIPHRLPGRIGGLLAILGVPSFIGFVLGSPAIFFHAWGGPFHGVFFHANTLGAFASLWLVVGIGVYDSRSSRRPRIVLVGIVAMALCVLASRTRGGVGATLIATACYFLVTRKMARLSFAGVLLGTLTLGAYIAMPSASDLATQESSDFLFKGHEEDVLASRRGAWSIGWENFQNAPWFGHGFGTSVGEETNEWRIVNLGGREKCNAYLAALEETGICGLLVLGFPLVLCVAGAFRLKRLNLRLAGPASQLGNDARLAAAFWAGAMGGLAHNYTESMLWTPGFPTGGMMLFLAGAAEGLMIRTEDRL